MVISELGVLSWRVAKNKKLVVVVVPVDACNVEKGEKQKGHSSRDECNKKYARIYDMLACSTSLQGKDWGQVMSVVSE